MLFDLVETISPLIEYNLKMQKDLHYSSVTTLSRKDLDIVKEIFMRAIEDSKKIVRLSEGEKVCVTTLNFFEIA